MDNNKLNRIFTESDCISNKMMLDYLDGKLMNKEKNMVEVHLENCELCKDEFDGLKEMVNKEKLPEIVSKLDFKITMSTHKRRKIALFPQVSAMAAIVLLLVGFAWFFFYIIHISPQSLAKKEMAQALEKAEEQEEMQKLNEDNKIDPNEKIDITIVPADKKADGSKRLNEDGIQEVNETKRFIPDNEIALSNDIYEYKETTELEDLSINTVVIGSKDFVVDTLINSKSVIAEDFAYIPVVENKKQDRSKSKKMENRKEQPMVELTNFQMAITEFENKNYKKAIDLFQKSDENKEPNDKLYFYLGKCYQNIDNQKNAIAYYDKVLVYKSSKYYELALWNKSQIQIKTGKNSDAIQNLNMIINNKGQLKNQALQQIDSLKTK